MLRTLIVIPILLIVLAVPAVMQDAECTLPDPTPDDPDRRRPCNVTTAEELSVEGTAEVDGSLTAGDDLSVADDLTVDGTATVGSLSTDGDVTLYGTLFANANAMVGGTLAVGGSSTVADITASGTVTTPTLRLGTRTLTQNYFPISQSEMQIGSMTSTGTGTRSIPLPDDAELFFLPTITGDNDCQLRIETIGIIVSGLSCDLSNTVQIHYIME